MSGKFEELSQYILQDMRMSHIYQPVMIIELLNRGGEARVRHIAEALAKHDFSQVEYYEERTKRMVGPVLTKNRGITEYLRAKQQGEQGSYRLKGFDSLTDSEISILVELCNNKIERYIEQRGDEIWAHRRRSRGYISGSIKWRVIRRASGRCEACGVSSKIKSIEVDHIVPKNWGGSDDLSNFQALCYSCNRMKRDSDDTDFREIASSYQNREAGCVFCEPEDQNPQEENELCYAKLDSYPVTSYHTLIIPKRHVLGFFDLYQPELNAVYSLLDRMRQDIQKRDRTITGFNVGVNSGEDAGQTIPHCHIHLIPRRRGDTSNPRGGVRGVIPERQSY